MSRLRRLVLSDRWFFLTCNLSSGRLPLSAAEFACLAGTIKSRRRTHGFLLTAWVVLPDPWHAILLPRHLSTISVVMEAIKVSSTRRINALREVPGRLWQGRFFDRALRTVRSTTRRRRSGSGRASTITREAWPSRPHPAVYCPSIACCCPASSERGSDSAGIGQPEGRWLMPARRAYPLFEPPQEQRPTRNRKRELFSSESGMKREAWRRMARQVPVSSSRWAGIVSVFLLPSKPVRCNFIWLPRGEMTSNPNGRRNPRPLFPTAA